ncbi:hypothetical protein T4C_1198 [Trichinella pseudospiralis]|uniref:Uncharacterized protein n=1 Tax=Trichinella pseudospiralis TaxID=6337 RepID=A0A0V1K8N8_TRIPS|nr:hypothetical protein T4C_1198 [Trichinella pseudospiralis]
MIKHRYGDRYLHNGSLEISLKGLELSEDLLLIGHFIFVYVCKLGYNNTRNFFPMSAPLILLLDMQEQLKEQESYSPYIKKFCTSFIDNSAEHV